jgi:gamma-glutamyl hydrolase
MRVVRIAKEINESARKFPIWGTCLGFETLLLSLSNMTSVITYKLEDNNVAHPVEFDDSKKSIFNGLFSVENFHYMAKEPLFCFRHEYGFVVDETLANEYIQKEIDILASQTTIKGEHVVAAYQHKSYPFVGVQYHPERVQFSSPFHLNINKTEESIEINRRHARIFLSMFGDSQRLISNIEVCLYKQHMWQEITEIDNIEMLYFSFNPESVFLDFSQ